MKKKGFTLVELLAVIVILAIIAVITTPMILNLIDNNKKENTSTLDGSVSDEGGSELIYTEYKTGIKDEVSTIYYNPVDATFCTESEYNNNSEKLGKTGCLKWYAIENSNSSKSTVNVILDHNTTPTVAWNSDVTNSSMKEVAIKLKEDTVIWNDEVKTTARLISADEIATITGNKTFNGATSLYSEWFYFDNNNQKQTATKQGESKYSWLFDYTKNCKTDGCDEETTDTNGYWTSTPVSKSPCNVWGVVGGSMYDTYVSNDNFYGIRPVITISKSLID